MDKVRAALTGRDEEGLAPLLRSAIAGDERAYAEFLERVAALVRGFARRRIVQGGVLVVAVLIQGLRSRRSGRA